MARLVAAATFIVGHPRSGTSLLRALLDGHPDLLVLPFETHLDDWVRAADPVSALLDRTKLLPTLLRHRPGLTRTAVEKALREAFDDARGLAVRAEALVRAWSNLLGAPLAKRWVEKTPRHLYESDRFIRAFGPATRVIVMRRDPRDVIASQLRQDERRSMFGLALTLRLAARVATELTDDPRLHVVSYELLVSDPVPTMHAVWSFLEIPEDCFKVEPTVLGAEYRGNSRFDSQIEGISEAGVGRYRTVLNEQQLGHAETLLDPVLASGGYERVTPMKRRHLLERAALRTAEVSGLWRIRSVRAAFLGA